MPPILVLFDIDGTLVSVGGAGRRALEQAFHVVFGIDAVAALAGGVRFEGRTDPVIIADMAVAAGIAPEEVDRRGPELREAYLSILREELARPDARRRLIPGVLTLLDRLRERPEVFLGLLTGNIEAGARAKLDPFGLNEYFTDGGFSSDHADRGEIARIAREKLSRRTGVEFPPERVVVVGDTDQDVACARANGYRVVVVESGFVPKERLVAARPDALFADFTDVAAVQRALGLEA